jgi:hypothetical protein
MLPSRRARAAHSAEPETLWSSPATDPACSIVPGSTPVGPLSLPEAPGSEPTFVEPASCKTELDTESFPEPAGLCTRSRKSWPTANQSVIVAVGSCYFSPQALRVGAAALIAAFVRFCHAEPHSDSPLSCHRRSEHRGYFRSAIVSDCRLSNSIQRKVALRKGYWCRSRRRAILLSGSRSHSLRQPY